MALAAGQLNRRVTFHRRSPAPTAPLTLRGGFVEHGTVWCAFKDGPPREVTVGGLDLIARVGTLTIRDSGFAQGITTSHLAELDGDYFEIAGPLVTERKDGSLRLSLVQAPNRSMYDQRFETRGEVITIRRIVPNAPAIEAPVRAIVTGYEPEELVGGIDQGDRKVIMSAEDLVAAGFPPPREGDRLIVRGRMIVIEEVDDSTHRYAGLLNAHQVRARGPR